MLQCPECKSERVFLLEGKNLFCDSCEKSSFLDFSVEITKVEKRLSDLLMHAGDEGKCRGCGSVIFWISHRNRKSVPYDPDGTSHYATCPVVERFEQHKATCKGYTEKG